MEAAIAVDVAAGVEDLEGAAAAAGAAAGSAAVNLRLRPPIRAGGAHARRAREIMNPPDHVTIVEAGTMVVITAPMAGPRAWPPTARDKDESTKSGARPSDRRQAGE